MSMPSNQFSTYPLQKDNQPFLDSSKGGFPSGPMAAGANHMNDIYFGAAACIFAGSFLGGICLFFQFKTVEWIQITYLMFFGLALAVLDTPVLKSVNGVSEIKTYIGKYLQFVTRVTGKGVTLVFLGSSMFLILWDNIDSGFMKFLAVILSFFPAMVGLASVAIGALKSSKLEKARKKLQAAAVFERYQDNSSVSLHEFDELLQSNGSIRFETLDLKLIFNALVSNPSWRAANSQSQQQQMPGYAAGEEARIPIRDLAEWTKGGMVFL